MRLLINLYEVLDAHRFGKSNNIALKIDGIRYRLKVVPGDTLVFHLHLITPIRRGIVHMRGIGYVNGQPAVEAEMMAQIVKDKNAATAERPVRMASATTA